MGERKKGWTRKGKNWRVVEKLRGKGGAGKGGKRWEDEGRKGPQYFSQVYASGLG